MDCAECRRRGQARVRQRKARGIGTGPDDPVPGLAGVTRQQVLDTWKSVEATRLAVRDITDYLRMCRQNRIEPSPAILLVEATLRTNLATLEALGDLYEQRVATVYPPLTRPERG